jgi:hypothetical protein
MVLEGQGNATTITGSRLQDDDVKLFLSYKKLATNKNHSTSVWNAKKKTPQRLSRDVPTSTKRRKKNGNKIKPDLPSPAGTTPPAHPVRPAHPTNRGIQKAKWNRASASFIALTYPPIFLPQKRKIPQHIGTWLRTPRIDNDEIKQTANQAIAHKNPSLSRRDKQNNRPENEKTSKSAKEK